MYDLLVSRNTSFINFSLLLLRCITGLILYVAGAGKVFGWYGGYGLKKTLEAFWSMMHINSFWAYVSSFTELIGGFLLIIGLLARPAALFVAINMVVATIYVGTDKFFAQAAYPLTLAITSFVILLLGPGSISLDALLFRSKPKIKARYR